MHALYLHYLSCKSEWTQSTLVVSVRKEFERQNRALYEYWTFSKMEQELGSDLAADLKARHEKAEQELPKDQKGKFIKKQLGFVFRVDAWAHRKRGCKAT